MFKKFNPDDDVVNAQKLKSSAQRAIVNKLLEAYPKLSEEVLEEFLPKNTNLLMAKW